MTGKTLAIILAIVGALTALWFVTRGPKKPGNADDAPAPDPASDPTTTPDPPFTPLDYPRDPNLLYGYCVTVPSYYLPWTDADPRLPAGAQPFIQKRITAEVARSLLGFFKAAGIAPKTEYLNLLHEEANRWIFDVMAGPDFVTVNSLRCPAQQPL